MYVSVVDEAGAPGSGPRPVRFRRPRRQRRPRSPARRAADDPMQIAILVDNSQAARDYIARHPHGPCRRSSMRSPPTRAGGRTRSRIIALGERPTILAEPTIDAAQLKKGSRPDLRAARQRQLPARRHHRSQPGIQEARSARGRSSSPSRPKGPEFSSRHFDLVLDPLREAGAAFNVHRRRTDVERHDR